MELLSSRKLTEANVRNLPPTDGRGYVVRDTEIKGFLVIVNKRSKSWAVQRDLWKGPRGNRRLVRTVRYTIGRVGTVPLRVAREKALEAVTLIQHGVDPNHQEPGQSLTLSRMWQDYIDAMVAKGRAPRSIEDFEFNLGYFKDWKDVTLVELGAERIAVRERHKRITRDHGPYAANRAMRALRAAYNQAMRVDDSLPVNPVIAVTFNRERRRNTVILPDELPAWWQKVHQLENPVRRDLHIFLLLTGMRRRAATGGRWEHFDPQSGLLVVPNPKGGEDRAFDLPLSDYLIDLLKRRYEENQVAFEGSPWIWPADSKSGHVAEPKETKRGLPSPHSLRHSYASFAKAAGLGQLDIALLMNHKLPGVTGGYIHETALIDHLRTCQERVTKHILGVIGDQEEKASP